VLFPNGHAGGLGVAELRRFEQDPSRGRIAPMLQNVFLLLAGLVLLVTGGDWFVGASVRLAELLRLPKIVVGTTLVSLATTLPELVVSITAGVKGESGLAVGNAVGSCVCNIGLILGASAALKHVDVHPPALRRPLTAMVLFGLLLFVLTLGLVLRRWQGLLLTGLGLGYFAWDFLEHSRNRKPAEQKEAAEIERAITGRFRWLRTPWGAACQFAGGAGVVVLGSRLLVDGAVNIAGGLGIRPIVIGLTVVAIGTSLPELVTALTSSRKNVSDLSVGNVLGANIANLTIIVGVAAALHEVRMDRATQAFNFPALLASMLLFLYVILTGNRVTRRQGVLLLGAYALYIAAIAVIGMHSRF
jgi:cation:H+ antiporter